MANYKPVGKKIGSASAKDGTIMKVNLTVVPWSMMLLLGTAKHSNSVLPSGAVLVWENTNTGSGNTPNHQTFGDAKGRYGVSVRSGVSIIFKYYSK